MSNIKFDNGVLYQSSHFENILIPIGGVISLGLNMVSENGWLLCDGSQISRTTYSDLFSVIGTQWGEGDGSTTFHLPDLRGRFIRGRDRGQGNDPYANDRISSNNGGAVGDNVGSYLDYRTGIPTTNAFVASGYTYGVSHNHTHNIDVGPNGFADPNNTCRGEQGASNTVTSSIPSANHTHYIGSITVSYGDSETSPKNMYVEYIIRAY